MLFHCITVFLCLSFSVKYSTKMFVSQKRFSLSCPWQRYKCCCGQNCIGMSFVLYETMNFSSLLKFYRLWILVLRVSSCLFRLAMQGYSVILLILALHSHSLFALFPWASCFALVILVTSLFRLCTCIFSRFAPLGFMLAWRWHATRLQKK